MTREKTSVLLLCMLDMFPLLFFFFFFIFFLWKINVSLCASHTRHIWLEVSSYVCESDLVTQHDSKMVLIFCITRYRHNFKSNDVLTVIFFLVTNVLTVMFEGLTEET